MRAGQYLDAQLCCQQALAIDPGHADALHLMGLLCLNSEQFDHAVEWIARALRQDPKPEYLYSLGTALRQQGRFDDALKAFDKAIQLKPDKAEPWIGLGTALVDLDRRDEALLAFQHALKLNPQQWNAAYQCGLRLLEAGRLEEALAYIDIARELQPDRLRCWNCEPRCASACGDSKRLWRDTGAPMQSTQTTPIPATTSARRCNSSAATKRRCRGLIARWSCGRITSTPSATGRSRCSNCAASTKPSPSIIA